jgi:hypothetical protein
MAKSASFRGDVSDCIALRWSGGLNDSGDESGESLSRLRLVVEDVVVWRIGSYYRGINTNFYQKIQIGQYKKTFSSFFYLVQVLL